MYVILTPFIGLFFAADAFAQLRLTETGGGTEYVGLQAPAAVTSSLTWTFPATDGNVNQCLATNGASTLIWGGAPGTGYSLDASDGNPANVMYVEAGGRVGIGITSPLAGAALDITGTGTAASAIIVPRDTTANRPATGVNGMIRYNTTTDKFEGYENGTWINLAGGLYGKLDWPGTANCIWTNTTGSGAWINYAADADCPNPTATGGASAPATKVPGVVLNNLPAGDYEITMSAMFFDVGANCRWAFSDGTTNSGIVTMNQVSESIGTMTGLFSYASAATRTITVRVIEASGGNNACLLRNNETINKMELWVKRL